MSHTPWLPSGWTHPLRVDLPTGHHLRPIRAGDVDLDMKAVMGSQERLWSIYGQAWGWPPADMTVDQDREDLRHHEREIESHESFNYALFDAAETELLGCVYIDPPAKAGADAEISWWVVDCLVGGPIEAALDELVPQWIASQWPFRRPRYVGRDLSWAEWMDLPDHQPEAGPVGLSGTGGITTTVVFTLLAVVAQLIGAAGPASAGELGITVTVQGSGKTEILAGEVEDGASPTCDWFRNQDERISRSCAPVRVQEEGQEAWAWIRATANPEPTGHWLFIRWEGCDFIRKDDPTLCGVHSSESGTVEASPKAVFEDIQAPTVSNVTWRMHPSWYSGSLGTATYSFSTDEGRTECRFDEEPTFGSCVSPVSRDYETEGWHGIEVRAVDRSGQISASKSASVLLLETTIASGPADLVRSRDARFEVSSGMGTGYTCSLDHQLWAPCAADGTVTFSNLGDGEHLFFVAATNGTWRDPSPAVHRWTVDATAPETYLDASSLDGRSATFTFDGAGSPQSYQCRLNAAGASGAWSTCSSPVAYTDLADATYRFEVRATDAAGNTDATPAYRDFTVDTTAPETSITSGPAARSFLLSTSTLLRISSTQPGGTFSCSLNGVPVACGGGSAQLAGLARRTHVFTASAIDPYGNTDPTAARRVWTVPLNNTDLGHSHGWAKRRSSATYLGTYSETSRRGSSLSKGVAGARRVALVATRAPGHGKVSVYAGSRWLATVSLAASTRRTKQVIPVATFQQPYTGTLRLVVRSAGKPVRVEGLGVATE